jgi:hypothetical protein
LIFENFFCLGFWILKSFLLSTTRFHRSLRISLEYSWRSTDFMRFLFAL